jgi:hypothetical protein
MIAGLVLGLIVAGVVALMVIDVPPPSAPIEKELDAKAFLTPKQP